MFGFTVIGFFLFLFSKIMRKCLFIPTLVLISYQHFYIYFACNLRCSVIIQQCETVLASSAFSYINGHFVFPHLCKSPNVRFMLYVERLLKSRLATYFTVNGTCTVDFRNFEVGKCS